MIIAIDGPTASGKGTIAKRVAAHYGFHLLDTGLLYRAVARAVLDASQSLENSEAATTCAQKLDFGALDESRLRTREIGDAASVVSAYPGVRQAVGELLLLQPGVWGSLVRAGTAIVFQKNA